MQVGAVIYRAHFGMDRSNFQSQQGLINQLVPDDIYPDQKIDDWKKQIINAYSKQMGKIQNVEKFIKSISFTLYSRNE